MEQEELPYFTLEHRILAWNLLYDFAKSVKNKNIDGFGLSPFLTTAFTYLLRFFNNKDILISVNGKQQPDKDLFTMIVVAQIVSSKQFVMKFKLRDFIQINFEIVKKYPPDQQKLLGESALFAYGEDYEFEQFKSEVLQGELYLLTYIGWNLLSYDEFPFSYFQHWCYFIRTEADKRDELNNFRKMRGRAVHFMISLMVVLNDPKIKPDVLAAASIHGALSYIPLASYSVSPDNDSFWATLVKADVNVDGFISLSQKIPDVLESLKPFMLQTENINK